MQENDTVQVNEIEGALGARILTYVGLMHLVLEVCTRVETFPKTA